MEDEDLGDCTENGGGEITRQQRDVQSRLETHVEDRDRAAGPPSFNENSLSR